MNFSNFHWFINYGEYHNVLFPVAASVAFWDSQLVHFSIFSYFLHTVSPRGVKPPRVLEILLPPCVLVCDRRLLWKGRNFSYQWKWETFFSVPEAGGERWREALKNYPIISNAHHRSDWKALKSTLSASILSFLTHFSLSLILQSVFSPIKISSPRPCR